MDKQIKIESGVPITDGVKSGRYKYPFAQMKVNDSFAIPSVSAETQRRLCNAARGFVSRNGKGARFITRCLTENGQRVVRIWRVK